MSSPGGLTWSVGIMSIFDTVRLTDLGSKTSYRIITRLSWKMSSDLLINHADS